MKNKASIIFNVLIILIILAGIVYWASSRPVQAPVEQPQPTAPVFDEQAQEQLKASIESPPTVAEDLDLTQEQIYKYLSDYDEVIEEVRLAEFDTLQGINQVAQIKRSLGDFQGAIDAWLYANFIRPGNSLSFSNLAALYHYDLHEFAKAEEQYLISIANDPDDLPTIRNFYELYYYDFKDNDKAEALLLKAVEDNSENPDIYTLTGRFYADIGEYEKAIEYYEKHLELLPDNQNVIREVNRLKGLLEQ